MALSPVRARRPCLAWHPRQDLSLSPWKQVLIHSALAPQLPPLTVSLSLVMAPSQQGLLDRVVGYSPKALWGAGIDVLGFGEQQGAPRQWPAELRRGLCPPECPTQLASSQSVEDGASSRGASSCHGGPGGAGSSQTWDNSPSASTPGSAAGMAVKGPDPESCCCTHQALGSSAAAWEFFSQAVLLTARVLCWSSPAVHGSGMSMQKS